VILDKWKETMDKKDITLSCFIDFQKAFDYVESDLLLLKLFHYGFDNDAFNLIRDYFCERKQMVRIGNQKSKFSPITLGVPQGSVLGHYSSLSLLMIYN
jgi:hypothetical protein